MDRRSMSRRPFANRGLNRAVVRGRGVLAAIIHVLETAMALTVVPALETVKAAARRGRSGARE